MRKYRQTEFPDVHSSKCEAQLASPDELSAYIDRELPAWKRHLIRRHLKKCEVCANHVHRLQQTDNFLRHAGEVETSNDFLSSVMAGVSDVVQHQQQQKSFWSRIGRFVEASFGWAHPFSILIGSLRYNIRTRSPIYIFVLTFAVFTMVGATLYQSSSDRFGQSVHALKKSHALDGEKLISFEVIQHEPPKRLLTTYLQRK
ncbi:MAG: zf-HC2 domain-containing protein [Candidatus Poribacteria bacterium]|nr:zf-HC2 domain-containing protein [Candidatus Poribacteria bacterium]MDE0323454.1 zf-HC2 domain-containing protein [Candidatus Poribacteria bacterium]